MLKLYVIYGNGSWKWIMDYGLYLNGQDTRDTMRSYSDLQMLVVFMH